MRVGTKADAGLDRLTFLHIPEVGDDGKVRPQRPNVEQPPLHCPSRELVDVPSMRIAGPSSLHASVDTRSIVETAGTLQT